MGNNMKSQDRLCGDKATEKPRTKDTAAFFTFTTVTKEELEKRRIPVYPYIL